MKNLLFILFVLFSCSEVFSQTIVGKVIEEGSDYPMEFTYVALYGAKDSVLVDGSITDVNGFFTLKSIKPGEYYMQFSFVGYFTKTLGSITFSKGQNLDLGSIFIQSDQQLLEGVEVDGQRITSEFKLDKQSYSAESFQSSQGGTATDVLKNLPGVSINADGGLSIRGSSGFVVMLNGKPVQSDPMMLLAQLPANSIEKVEWISSPSAKYDSEGKGGLINITTKRGAADGLYLQFNSKIGAPPIQNYGNKDKAQRYGGDFNLNWVSGKWDVSLGASYQRNDVSGRRVGNVYTIDGDTTTFFPSEGERSINEKNYSGRFTLGYTPNEKHNVSLGFFGGVRDKLRTADILYFDNHREVNGARIDTFQYFNANDQNRRGDLALGSLDYTFSMDNGAKLMTSFLYEYTLLGGPTTNRNLGYPDVEEVYQDEYNTNDNPLHGTRINVDYQFTPFSIGQLQTGYQFRSLDHTGDFLYERKNNETGVWELVPEFSSDVELIRTIHSGYVHLDGEKQKWTYGVGVRVESMDRDLSLQDKAGSLDTLYRYDFIRPFLSASLAYQLKEELQLKANFSQRVERTITFKMNPFPEREHSETLEQGDPRLLPEFINQVEVGLIKTWKDNSIYANVYHSRVKNLVNRVNTVYNDTILNRIYSNVGTGRSTGLDLGAELYPTRWLKLFAGLNWYHYSIQGSFENRPVDTKTWVHSINFNSTFTISPKLSAQASLNYLSDRVTALGKDSRFYTPSLTVRKSWLERRLTANFVWQNIDMGLLKTNEQRITTWREGEFYTTTNYIQEVDMLILNLSYTLNGRKNRSKFVNSEFGVKEF